MAGGDPEKLTKVNNAWMSWRYRSVLQQTQGGRHVLMSLYGHADGRSAPLLMDGCKDTDGPCTGRATIAQMGSKK